MKEGNEGGAALDDVCEEIVGADEAVEAPNNL